MIQFNLLPDIKLQYIRARRAKRMVMIVATGISVFTFTAAIILFLSTNVFQASQIKHLSATIQTDSKKLQGIPDLNKILTIQNQLDNLPALDNQSPVASRLFGYLSAVTPTQASISELNVDFTTGKNLIVFTGNADSLETVNKFADTLKFTTYTAPGITATKAFSNVVLTNFTRDSKIATYTITANFDPAIFDTTKSVSLSVPNIITTRSATDSPTDLFQTITKTTGN